MQRLNADGSYTVETSNQQLWGTSAYAANALVYYVAPGTLDGNTTANATPSASSGPNGQASGSGSTGTPTSGGQSTQNALESFFSGIKADVVGVSQSIWVKYAVWGVVIYLVYRFVHKTLRII